LIFWLLLCATLVNGVVVLDVIVHLSWPNHLLHRLGCLGRYWTGEDFRIVYYEVDILVWIMCRTLLLPS
jgi:hypothetical protein